MADITNYSTGIADEAKRGRIGPGDSNWNTTITSQIIDGVCEGPIEGWPTTDPLKHIYFDGTSAKDKITLGAEDDRIKLENLRLEFKKGTGTQSPLSKYSVLSAAKQPSWTTEIFDKNDATNGGAPIIQQIQIRDDSDGSYPPVEAVAFTFYFPEGIWRQKDSGGRDNTSIVIKIEVNNKNNHASEGVWTTRVDDMLDIEATNEFERTYIIELPPAWTNHNSIQNYTTSNYIADDIISFRITKYNSKLDADGHSKMFLKSYTLYTRNQFQFPYTALVGTTFDSKNFDGSIPRRQYDLKLLRVKIPNNYTLTYDSNGNVTRRQYTGTWNGNFTTGWTDNPAWCLYDLITNTRYGLGQYIDSSLVNKWKLYEIAKYCDAAVLDSGNYVFDSSTNPPIGGIDNGYGIYEPRFTCNMYITNREEAYSVVQKLASIFRGIVIFKSGTLQPVADMPSNPATPDVPVPLLMYNNTNVLGGIFSYSGSSLKARHTVAIVKWLDPSDLYSEKLEYVEDYDAIAHLGYREIEIDGIGCTSRAQARRIGKHILISEKFELETISFKTGAEGALASPGQIIKVKDSHRQTQRAGGRTVSSTSNVITLDKSIVIPSGATNIKLWVETKDATTESIGDGFATQATYLPSLTSYNITNGAGTHATLTLSSGTFTYTPIAGAPWVVSYTPSGDDENPTYYKILSVNEVSNTEYEITALEHYPLKYTAIESTSPLPVNVPVFAGYQARVPDKGWISHTVNSNARVDLTISWETTTGYVSGTKYNVAISTDGVQYTKVVTSTSDLSVVIKNRIPAVYYARITTIVTATNSESNHGLVLGPYKADVLPPANSFSSFSLTPGSNQVQIDWVEDPADEGNFKYEAWRSAATPLRTSVFSGLVQAVSVADKKVTLTGFDGTSLTGTITKHRLEKELNSYVYKKAANFSAFGYSQSTNTTTIALEESVYPDIILGDKLYNVTRNATTNVVNLSITKLPSKTYYTVITVSPAVTGQVAGDIFYTYKGVMGLSLIKTERSVALKPTAFKGITGTTTTTIKGFTNQFTNVSTGDIITNRTRVPKVSRTVTKTDNQTLTVTAVTSQAVGDTFYTYSQSQESTPLIKYSAAFATVRSFYLYKLSTPDEMPNIGDIIINATRGKAAVIVGLDNREGVTPLIRHSPDISAQTGNDVITILKPDQVFISDSSILAAGGAGFHPTPISLTATTTSTTYKSSAAFGAISVNDIIVNATRLKSSVVLTKPDSSTITLASAIDNSASGDMIFVVSPNQPFTEKTTYVHPTIFTATASTSATQLWSTGNFPTSVTAGYIVYNATRNLSGTVQTRVSANQVTLSGAGITGQVSGDSFYYFPSSMTVSPTTTVYAVDGAFRYVREGDAFVNVTRGTSATIKSIIKGGSKIDKLILNSAITNQAAGDEFKIIQGYYSATVKATTDNGANDIITTANPVQMLNIGDRVTIYRLDASRIKITTGTPIVDTGLAPDTLYYYMMRVVSTRLPYLTGAWIPSTTGQSTTTLVGTDNSNYNTSNDNRSSAITSIITPTAGGISLVGVNKDSTANIILSWEYLGNPAYIDGFNVYFWSSDSESDDVAIDADDDWTQADWAKDIPTNKGIAISNITGTGTVTVTTSANHGLSTNDKVRILNVKGLTGINNTGDNDTDYYTITVTGNTTFTITASPGGTYTASTGVVKDTAYKFQVNNLTANYYYNAWIQPYRTVNHTVNEAGVIYGAIKKLY